MPAVQVNGKKNTSGGGAVVATGFMTVGGQKVSVNGDVVPPHPPNTGPHASPTATAQGPSWFTVGGKPVNVDGNLDTCGSHTRTGGLGWFTIG